MKSKNWFRKDVHDDVRMDLLIIDRTPIEIMKRSKICFVKCLCLAIGRMLAGNPIRMKKLTYFGRNPKHKQVSEKILVHFE